MSSPLAMTSLLFLETACLIPICSIEQQEAFTWQGVFRGKAVIVPFQHS